MDPKRAALDPKQQETLSRIMSTQTSSQIPSIASPGAPPQAKPDTNKPPITPTPSDISKPAFSPSQAQTASVQPGSLASDASPFPSFSSSIPDPATVKPQTPTSPPLSPSPTTQATMESAKSPFVTPQPTAGPTDVKSYENIPVAKPPAAPPAPATANAQTVIKAGTVSPSPSTAPTNTKTPPLPTKHRSPLIMILFIFLGLILMAAYTIVWALVFGLTLPFALPF